ncbi:uncharacterized protein LOC131636414 [Vicia villosa]|uniref:uncharacterized protein LOC131636414 n=1 Tax=Vicia villosa TaxID=3911 RepID=UPI00273B9576|nr:uncharacterized protein LOC131636414 [Vicia villosa]
MREKYPVIFSLSSLKLVSVAGMGGWRNGIWKWGDLGVNLPSLSLEHRMDFNALEELLGGMVVGGENRDKVEWKGDAGGDYTVASCYGHYASFRIPYGPPNRCDGSLEKIWKMEVPYKIRTFGWRLCVNRLPLKDLLKVRGIEFPLTSLNCVFCGVELEDRKHSFFLCKIVKYIWKEIAFWVDKPYVSEEECLSCFWDWYSFCKGKNLREKKRGVIWLATTWTIWLCRNGVCFRNDEWNVNDMVWSIKYLVWKWNCIGEITYPNSSFYDFSKDPLLFMS